MITQLLYRISGNIDSSNTHTMLNFSKDRNMKKILTTFAVFAFFAITSALAQDIIESPMNQAYIDYLQSTEKGKFQETTQSGHTLGLIPNPFPKDVNYIPKKNKKDKLLAPSRFDLRNVNGNSYVTSVKDQSACGSCWAFATMGAIESAELMLGNGTKDYSEQNIKNCHGFYPAHCSGGNEEIAASYVSKDYGPVSESDDSYNYRDGNCVTTYNQQTYFTHGWYLPNRYVSGYQDVLKEILQEYGGIFTSMRWESGSYNSATKNFRYAGNGYGNHAVVLVGWDDNRDMSSVGATNPGAWIIKNSWGSNWGESGYFYISYEDTRVHEAIVVWPYSADVETSDKLYYYDEVGGVSSVGYNSNTGYALTKFVATENQNLTKVGTWVRYAGTEVSFEIYGNFDGSSLSNLLGTVSAQTVSYAGYHTFNLSSSISLSNGDDFYVKVKYVASNTSSPISVERVIGGYCYPTISSSVSWLSNNGTSWTAIGSNTNYNYDACIRAYATTNSNSISSPSLISPTNNAGNTSLTPKLDWDEVSGCDSYEIQLSEYSNFSDPIIDRTGVTATEIDIATGTLEKNTLYFWRVRAKDGTLYSLWTERQFTTASDLVPPDLLSPSDRAFNISVIAEFDWSDVNAADSYRIQISTNSSFTGLVIDQSDISLSTYQITSGMLNFDTYYYWRIKAVKGSASSNWTEYRQFRTSGVPRPSLTSPRYRSTDLILTPTMEWEEVTIADSYDLQISSDYRFNSTAVDVEGVTDNSYDVPANVLEGNTEYYWRVRVRVGQSVGYWSSRWRFTTSGSAGPTLISPADNANDILLTATLDWEDATNALYYELEVSTNSSFTYPIISVNDLTSSQYTIPSNRLDENTLYYWRVRIIKNRDISTWTERKFTTLNSNPGPELVSPSNYSSNMSVTPTFNWADVTGVDYYILQVSTRSSFGATVIDESSLSESEFTVPANTLQHQTYYYWRVKYVKNGAPSEWSDVWRIRTMSVPRVSRLTTPSYRSTNVDISPTFEWLEAEGVTGYVLQVCADYSMDNPIVYETNISSNNFSLQSIQLDYDTEYYWRVACVCGDQTGYFTGRYRFTTKKAKAAENDGIAEVFEKYNVNIFPNPASDKVNIEVDFGSAKNVIVSLTDLTGKQLLKFEKRNVSSINDFIYIDNLPAGVYLIRMQIDGQAVTRKVIKK